MQVVAALIGGNNLRNVAVFFATNADHQRYQYHQYQWREYHDQQ
jgi:hypothetical protein